MKYFCQVLAIALLTFAEASVLINIIDNDTNEITNLANGLVSSNVNPVNTNKLTTCNAKSCVFSCHILNFSDGRCKDDICECIYKLRQNDMNKSQRIGDCSPLECDQLCRRIGFPGGVCVNNRCKCDII